MKFKHHDMEVEVIDAWWTEAHMDDFPPAAKCYRVKIDSFPDRRVSEVPIKDVGPVRRNLSAGVFNDNNEASARERVVAILRGFRSGAVIPPVEIVVGRSGYEYRYKLVHGVHRFYCSLAAGFTHVPAVEGFDITALDE